MSECRGRLVSWARAGGTAADAGGVVDGAPGVSIPGVWVEEVGPELDDAGVEGLAAASWLGLGVCSAAPPPPPPLLGLPPPPPPPPPPASPRGAGGVSMTPG